MTFKHIIFQSISTNKRLSEIMCTPVLQPGFFNLDGSIERGKTPCTVTPAGATMVGPKEGRKIFFKFRGSRSLENEFNSTKKAGVKKGWRENG